MEEFSLDKLLGDPAELAGLVAAAREAGPADDAQSALLQALRPLLEPDLQEKVDRAARALRLARTAGAVLRGELEEKEGEAHV